MHKEFLLIGIGGMGMAPLALYLHQQGHTVYGYDDALPEFLGRFFEKQQIIICEEFPEKIDTVIYSSAVSLAHTWIIEAKKRSLEIIRRGEFLATFCATKKIIAVTGSHGKTTTTGMLIDALPGCDYILGGFFQDFENLPAMYRHDSEYLICEVDESDRTIEQYSPYITVVINLEDDHLVQYQEPARLDQAFEILFQKTQKWIIFPPWNARLRNIASKINADKIFPSSKCSPSNPEVRENFWVKQEVLNALKTDNNPPAINETTCYSPLYRRNQYLGKLQNIELWADYAHHPSELTECIAHFEKKYQSILLIFQPHRYSRTQQYAKNFAEVFAQKSGYFLPVYSAGEMPIAGGNIEDIAKHLPQSNNIRIIQSLEDLSIDGTKRSMEQFNRKKSGIIFPEAIIFVGAGTIFEEAQKWIIREKMAIFKAKLTSCDIAFQENFPAKKCTTLQSNGNISLLVEPKSPDELAKILQFLKPINLPYCILGHGSNLLLDSTQGAFISLKKLPPILKISDDQIEVSANISLPFFCRNIATQGFEGCENLAGIPGTLGGALYMNAGAHKQSISDFLIDLEAMDASGEIFCVKKESIPFSYRQGYRDGIILSARFKFSKTDSTETLLDTIHQQFLWRQSKQPQEPNIGSIFKNFPDSSAGALIEQNALKGREFGGAKVSEKHANFIVNHSGNITPQEVKKLINLCRQKVFERNRIFLKREILFASELF